MTKTFTLLLTVLSFWAYSQDDGKSERGALLNSDQLQEHLIDSFIVANQKEYDIPAVSVAIIKEGEIAFFKNYGVSNSITNESLPKNAVFEAASISKPVFAYLVCRLAQNGEIDLDDPIHNRLAFPQAEDSPAYKEITARHVLTHVSGLPNWGVELINEPGTTYGYSGQGFEFLTKALARTYKNKMNRIIGSYLDEYVLEPFEMTNTFYVKSAKLKKRCVEGHLEGKPAEQHFPTSYEMAYGMHCDAKDIAKFAIAMMNREGLNDTMAKEMFSIQTPMPEHEKEFDTPYDQGYGLGFYLRESPYGMVFGHSGSNYDFECLFEVYDELKMGYVVMTNSDSGDELTFKMADFLVEGL